MKDDVPDYLAGIYDAMEKKLIFYGYTVSKCREDDSLFGPVHAAQDNPALLTLCGFFVGDGWWIVENEAYKNLSSDVTCKKCLAILRRAT